MTFNDPIGQQLTVVMYHYVRPLEQSQFPRLKALELQDFIGQLDWLTRHYTMISPHDLSTAISAGSELPPRPCLLTFDDGYSDHYAYVFPELIARGIKGLFFSPYASLIDRQILEVNKIQFVLASHKNPDALADELDAILLANGLADPTPLRAAHSSPNRFDTAEVSYVKHLLQHALPAKTRAFVVNHLFNKHVTADETAFAEDLYLTPQQAFEMRTGGMEFGGHGGRHLWHDHCSPDDLKQEVTGSADALHKIDAPVDGGYYCYPFGGQNAAVRSAVKSAGFKVGFTVKPSLNDMSLIDPLQISRLDTRDLPFNAEATGNPWLDKAGPVEAAQ